MNRLTAFLLLAALAAAHGKLADVYVSSIVPDPADPDSLYVRIEGIFECPVAVTRDGGMSFEPADPADVPRAPAYPGASSRAAWLEKEGRIGRPGGTEDENDDAQTVSLRHGGRDYLLADGFYLLASDDGGTRWKRTGLTRFVRDRADRAATEAELEHMETYRKRLPQQGPAWRMAFAAFAAATFLSVVLVLRRRGGRVQAALTATRAVAALGVLFLLFVGVHAQVTRWALGSWPLAWWNSHALWSPSPRLGFAMSILARPLPLVVYLTALWPLLPGSWDVARALGADRTELRRRICLVAFVAVGSAFAAFHPVLILTGSLWE